MTGLTPRQRDCIDAIERLTVDGVSPTYQALAGELGLGSKSGVFRLLNELEERGWVKRLRDRHRTIEVVKPANEDLPTTIARLSGLLAHEAGETVAARILRRIADRLEHKPRVASS
jgi:SOS-response transcriptional repressor LexA